MKKSIISTVLIGVSFSTLSVFAEGYDDVRVPSSPEVSKVVPLNEKPETSRITSLAYAKARGAQLIRERVNSLESNKTVINASKTLSVEQKSSLIALLTTNSTGLTSLGGAIASSTDATTTKGLVQSVVTNFRIYGVVLPQVRLEKRIYDLQNHSVVLSDTFLKIQAKIDDSKAKGKDVTLWQKSLEDAKLLVATDMGALANLLTKVSALKASDYGTTSQSVIDATNADLKKISKDFSSIAKMVRKPMVLKNSTGTSTKEFSGRKIENH